MGQEAGRCDYKNQKLLIKSAVGKRKERRTMSGAGKSKISCKTPSFPGREYEESVETLNSHLDARLIPGHPACDSPADHIRGHSEPGPPLECCS